MKLKLILGIFAVLLLSSSPAITQVELKDGRVWLNGERQDTTVWARSCFKLPNHLTYNYTGQGAGYYGLRSARSWVDEQILQGWDGCRALLETAGWAKCESGAQANDGKPDNCMFGSEPVDKGFWNVEALRNGGRPTTMRGVGKNVLRWFFATSQETKFMFELVIIATLKHDDVSQGQQTHVIRQTLAEAYKLQQEFPQANILMSAINEYNAHAPGWTTAKLNLVAVRADRWKHPDGRTVIGCSAPAGFVPEQWPCGPLIADPGGGNTFVYDVGPEPGKLDMGAIHPKRNTGWELFPGDAQKVQLVVDSRGQPWGFTESMFLVEIEDLQRAARWYPGRGDRWTTNWSKYKQFLDHMEEVNIPYFVAHDEKGVETVVGWPRQETRLERWARNKFTSEDNVPDPDPDPDPPPAEKLLYYDQLIEFGYLLVLDRTPDRQGLDVYNEWFRICYEDVSRNCITPFLDVLATSLEYESKNTR